MTSIACLNSRKLIKPKRKVKNIPPETIKKRIKGNKEGQKVETTEGADIEMKNMKEVSTEPVSTTERNISPVVDDEIETIKAPRIKARVAVPEDFNPMDILGGKRLLSQNRATSSLDTVLLDGGPTSYINKTESQLQREGMSLSDTAQGFKTTLSKAAGRVSKVLDEGATAITKSGGDLMTAGSTALGGGLTGLAGYETAKGLGGSTGISVGVGAAEEIGRAHV